LKETVSTPTPEIRGFAERGGGMKKSRHRGRCFLWLSKGRTGVTSDPSDRVLANVLGDGKGKGKKRIAQGERKALSGKKKTAVRSEESGHFADQGVNFSPAGGAFSALGKYFGSERVPSPRAPGREGREKGTHLRRTAKKKSRPRKNEAEYQKFRFCRPHDRF